MEDEVPFAPRRRLDAHIELEEEFVHLILGIPWAMLTDFSKLSHFEPELKRTEVLERIQIVYGVDVSDIESGNIADLLDRIATSKAGGMEN